MHYYVEYLNLKYLLLGKNQNNLSLYKFLFLKYIENNVLYVENNISLR